MACILTGGFVTIYHWKNQDKCDTIIMKIGYSIDRY